MSFRLIDTPIDAASLRAELENAAAGACVTFEGIVRNHNDGRAVLRLEYEAYPALANKEGGDILAAALGKFDILGALCVHRTGALEIGGMAVWVGVSAAHRGEAFDACRFIIDEVKHRVPIWKREFYADGSVEWVGCKGCGEPRHGHEPAADVPAVNGAGSMDADLGA